MLPALKARLTLVVSPAGFGKTTLLSQWRAELVGEGVLAGWLSLDEDDGDALHFLASLVLAAAAAGGDMGELEKIASQGLPEVPLLSTAARFLGMIARLQRPLVLILDDYHRTQSRDSDALIELLLARAPDNFHLILSGRERPALSLSGLKAQGLLYELGADVLRFSIEEAGHLLGGQLEADSVARLVTRTEGWGVALQLARLWLEGGAARADLIENFSGRTGDVADYLAEQVFSDLAPDVQTVLLETAVCERINGDLANVITGRKDGWDILARLERLNALLIPLDSERRWFRCHLLFRDFLMDQLQRRAADRIPSLHRAASSWFESEGNLVEALRHARFAEDYDQIARLIEAAGGWEMVLFGQPGILRNLFRQLPPEICFKYASLRYARAYIHIKDGELAEARGLIESAPLVDRSDYRAWRDNHHFRYLIDGYEDRLVTAEDHRRIRAYVDELDPADIMGFGSLWETLCVVASRLGDSKAVEEGAILAVRYMRSANCVLGINYAYYHLGMLQALCGRRREAEATLLEAVATAEDNFGVDSGQKAIAETLLSGVLYLRNDIPAARDRLETALPQVELYDSWFDILAFGFEAAMGVSYAEGGLAAAMAVFDRASETASRRRMPALVPFLQSLRVRVLLRAGDMLAAANYARAQEFIFTLGDWRQHPSCWRTHHASGLALASLYIGQGAPAHAFEVLDDLRAMAESGGRNLHLLQVMVQEALAHRVAGRHDEAFDRLMAAVRIGMAEGLVRVFLDEGAAMEALLAEVLRQQRETMVDSLAKIGLTRLLESLRAERLHGQAQIQPLAQSGLPSPALSEREREVLVELGHGYSNKEIARALNMTENTVKFHLKNIYAKLGVDKRGLAVVRAREQALIS
nr:LuxR C-terminal-related transcriptional regulator [Govania unica]